MNSSAPAPSPARAPFPPKASAAAMSAAAANNPQLQALIGRLNSLKASGHTPQTSQEMANILHHLTALSGKVSASHSVENGTNFQPTPPTTNGHTVPNGLPSNTLSSSAPITQDHPVSPQSPVQFTPTQITVLRAQIQAFKLLQRGLPVPEALMAALSSGQPIHDLEKLLQATGQGQDVVSKVVDSAAKIAKAGDTPTPAAASATTPAPEDIKTEDGEPSGTIPDGPFLEDDVDSGIYPYNAYIHPFTHLKRADPNVSKDVYASRLQRLLVPSLMPSGLDPHQIIAERNRYIEARIEQRITELSSIPATIGDGGLASGLPSDDPLSAKENTDPAAAFAFPPAHTHGKLRAVLELKALRLREKQRSLRAQVVERLIQGTLLPIDRKDFRRVRKPTFRDARHTEQLERKQRLDRERRQKQKHLDQLTTICNHGKDVLAVNRAQQDKMLRLGKAVQSYHAHTEKEEQKRMERISKERLRALKADDEEAYMKLIDTAKDTRITHLLRQTDSYLSGLAQAVMAQQNEVGGPPDTSGFEQEDGPASEATFGAQRLDKEEEETDKSKVDYYAVAHRISEKITHQPHILIGGTLKDYQLKGLQWMVSLYNNKLNGILADEMGLGKTIQTISLVTFLIESKGQRGPYLVIVPLSTMTNWSAEFAKWAPAVKVISYKGNPTQRKVLQNDIRIGNFQVLLTTYEYIIKDRPILSKMKWVHMIIDEGHRMKNTQSKLAQTLSTFYHSRYRLILTGTPLQNNLPELWALLNFALPKVFNSVKSFDEWFNTPFANTGTADKIELNEEEALLIIRRLHKVLRPFLLRRLKKDVESELPDKVEKVIKVKMSALQSQLYKQMKKHKMIADGGLNAKGKPGGVKGLSNELMQLRKICQHPFLFESVEDRMNPAGFIDDKIVRVSGKLELLSRILPKFFATGHRVLIFFQMTKVMDIMEDFMKMMGWKYLRLDGGTKTEERAGHVQMFNAKGSEFMVFILSTRAGGLGLNLQTADTVIIFDSDWNPHADLQAQDRAHRIGQTKAVRILRFITEKSVEEAMFARARYKLDIDEKVIQAGRFDNKSTADEQEEWLRAILEADQEEDNEEAGDMNDEELNELIARDDSEIHYFRDMDIQREREATEKWRSAGNRGKPPPLLIQLEELPDCYRNDDLFDNKDAVDEIEGRGQRKRTVVSYSDGLNDDEWAMALEDGEDLEEVTTRKRGRPPKFRDDSGASTPAPDGKKGRKGKGKAKDDYDATPLAGKRKRTVKAMSITPSVNDDDDEDDARDSKRRKKSGGPAVEILPAVKAKLKSTLLEVLKAVQECEDETGRQRSQMFMTPPSKADYPSYYVVIKQPMAFSIIRKRVNSHYYKSIVQFREDMRMMFNNAFTYNQEGSWVYIDAQEMSKVLDDVLPKLTRGTGLPGADQILDDDDGGMMNGGGMGGDDDDDDAMRPPIRRSGSGRKVVSDEEYLTPSDEE